MIVRYSDIPKKELRTVVGSELSTLNLCLTFVKIYAVTSWRYWLLMKKLLLEPRRWFLWRAASSSYTTPTHHTRSALDMVYKKCKKDFITKVKMKVCDWWLQWTMCKIRHILPILDSSCGTGNSVLIWREKWVILVLCPTLLWQRREAFKQNIKQIWSFFL